MSRNITYTTQGATWVKALLSLIFGVLLLTSTYAQVQFYTIVSETRLTPDRPFQVQYIIEGATGVERFEAPGFPGFQVEQVFDAPSRSRISPRSGNRVNAFTKVAILVPVKVGQYTIRGASAIVDGKSVKSNPVDVQVLAQLNPGRRLTDSDVQDESELRPGETIAQKIRENFFLTAQVNKSTCYVGEPITAVYKACSRIRNASSQVVKRPSLTGFSVVEMVDVYDGQATVESVGGKAFFVHLIRKVQLFPLQPGVYQLDAAEVESEIRFYQDNSARSGNDLQDFLDRTRASEPPTIIPHRVTLRSKPLQVSVKPLPEEGQPEGFSGAVGSFNLIARVDNKEVSAGTQVRIQFTITGEGNFPLINAPVITWPNGLDIVEAGTEDKTNAYVYPLSGSKTFTYLLTTSSPGIIQIPEATFSYFDPTSASYVSRQTLPMEVQVTGEAKREERKEALVTGRKSRPYPLHFLWFIPVVLIIVALIVYQVVSGRREKAKPQPNAETEPKISPARNAALVFSSADMAIATSDRGRFYTLIQQILWESASRRCEVPPSGLNKQNVSARLIETGVAAEIVSEFRRVLDECEWALYTPDVTADDMIEMRRRAAAVFDAMEG